MDRINKEKVGDKINLQSLFSVAVRPHNVLQRPKYTENLRINNK